MPHLCRVIESKEIKVKLNNVGWDKEKNFNENLNFQE